MPLYAYECPDCNDIQDEFRKVDNRHDPKTCECGGKMKMLIGGYNIQPDMQPYFDENLETHIKSRQHRKQVMRDKGVYEKFGSRWH